MAGYERSNRDVYRLLADDRRRAILASIAEAGSEVTIDELASGVVDRSSAKTDTRTHVPEAIETELVHHHVPMLHDAGFVAYDPDRRVVGPGERLERDDLLERVLDE